MKKRWIGAALLGILTAAEAGGSFYFYRRTMKRSRVSTERTMKMAGTDWEQYFPIIEERRKRMLSRPHEEIYVESFDGLKLHGTWFPAKEGEKEITKAVICFHGYSSCGMNDYVGLSDYYMRNGYSMLIVDERAHGKSQGEYVGFGCLDRKDALKWIDWVCARCGGQVQIVLHGISMGAATVLMTTGLPLPPQVKGVISDCAFTSPKEVFTHVLRSMYHLPAFPMIQISDFVNRKKAGYGLDECNAAREVRKAKVPALLIHGSADTFVPCRMCEDIYENYASDKRKLIIEGAAHAESYYKDMGAYENAMNEFLGGIVS
ncbi:MAG TPA: alpha/beta hydrolase [Candidatus Eisenbergiella pullistercoris]|uniref:Alpha/beta hydrolase n=1 Tax=Candidatus Eisenbergiella pullistercoris TaxID=2838555 RepID=A0A9D1YQK3_9FIRM|nr:alpha/beta hydrolase [Candidatus Eisenbergiella pullistercoris]